MKLLAGCAYHQAYVLGPKSRLHIGGRLAGYRADCMERVVAYPKYCLVITSDSEQPRRGRLGTSAGIWAYVLKRQVT